LAAGPVSTVVFLRLADMLAGADGKGGWGFWTLFLGIFDSWGDKFIKIQASLELDRGAVDWARWLPLLLLLPLPLLLLPLLLLRLCFQQNLKIAENLKICGQTNHKS
jgi:hypothetical protein